MKKSVFYIFFTIGILIRFFHLGEEIESPHTWRQSDTANYVWDFYKNGFDLLHPSVCWMGGHKTLILEFPLVEAIIAWCYNVFGPYQTLAKIIVLLFFLGSCYYFFKIAKYFLPEDIARIAVLIYLFAPLSQFYSRAIHIDYAAMFFAFGMVYFYMKGIANKNIYALGLGSVLATIAFVIKAPYAVFFAIPLLAYIIIRKRLLYAIKHFVVFVVPVILFVIWQNHVFSVNEAAPEWFYIPGYKKFTYSPGWYYGPLSQRLDFVNWKLIIGRIFKEILGVSGFIFCFLGLILNKKKNTFFIFWLIATFIYLLVFFNLNRVHNYYQIPFAPILSVFIAIGIHRASNLIQLGKLKSVMIPILVVFYALESTYFAERNYYIVQHLHLAIGHEVKLRTNENDLVIINFQNYDSKCPNFLYAAKRNGWQIPTWGLTDELIQKLILEGADYFGSARKQKFTGEVANFVKDFPQEVIPLQEGYNLYLYDLRSD